MDDFADLGLYYFVATLFPINLVRNENHVIIHLRAVKAA